MNGDAPTDAVAPDAGTATPDAGTATPDAGPEAFFAVERGTATLAASLIGRVGGRWRLLATAALPAGADETTLRRLLVERVRTADPGLAEAAGIAAVASAARPAAGSTGPVRQTGAPAAAGHDAGGASAADLPVLAAEGRPAPTLLIVAGTERTRSRAALVATGAGWRVATGGSAQRSDPLSLTYAGTRTGVRAVLAAVNDPPDSDERDLPVELSVVGAGIASRRRDVPLLLSGPLPFEPARAVAGGLRIVPLPPVTAGTPPGEALRRALLLERTGPTGTRTALVAAAASLARVLDLRVELLEIGASGGLRVRADPVAEAGAAARGPRALTGRDHKPARGGGPGANPAAADAGAPAAAGAVMPGGPGDAPAPIPAGAGASPTATSERDGRPASGPGGAPVPHPVRVRWMEVPSAALFTLDDAEAFDQLEDWSTLPLDRARLRDRLAELALTPWSEIDGEGAILRATALRAALVRLLTVTDPVLGRDAPDLAVGAGGAWSSIPGPAAAHVMADTLRRPGAVQLAVDHARLLAPLGTIEDDGERDAVVADMVDDLLLPLGTVITPRGLRANRAAGRLVLEAEGGRSEVDLIAGGIALVDLPPGAQGEVELSFKHDVELGPKGKRFAIAVSGGLAGLVVDLRDVPLRLPERPDRRREVLLAWERALWPERDA